MQDGCRSRITRARRARFGSKDIVGCWRRRHSRESRAWRPGLQTDLFTRYEGTDSTLSLRERHSSIKTSSSPNVPIRDLERLHRMPSELAHSIHVQYSPRVASWQVIQVQYIQYNTELTPGDAKKKK
jgi:hypothetical protein